MRVLLTRPEPGASRTAARLAELGFEPVPLPLTRIEQLLMADVLPADFDAVIVTSANAVRHAPPSLLHRTEELPCFVVGRETAAATKDAGFRHVQHAGGDASSLAGLVCARLPRGTRLLYLCGRLRRPTLEQALAEAGLDVVSVETYDTLPIDYDAGDIATLLGSEPVAAVMLFSTEAALAFLRLMKSVETLALAGNPRMICISQRVAAVLAGQGFQTVVAAEPTEASMLSALRGISPEVQS